MPLLNSTIIKFSQKILPFLLPANQPLCDNKGQLKPASVLFLFYIKNEEIFLVLTQRQGKLNRHAGQIAFAGGVIDKSESPKDCALREAYEEINLDISSTKILGYLPNQNTRTGYNVVPVVGIIDNITNIKINLSEVERLILIPWTFVTNRHNWHNHERMFAGNIISGPAFNWLPPNKLQQEGAYVWGLTALIVFNLIHNFW